MRARSVLKPSSPLLLLLPLIFVACGSGGGDSPAAGGAPAGQPSPPPAAQPDILTATSQGLLRGKANGQEQRLVFARTNMHQDAFSGGVRLANGLVYYERDAAPVIRDYPNTDLWSVRADGTGNRAVLNTTANEVLLDTSNNIAIYERGTYTLDQGRTLDEYGSLRDGAPLATLPITERFTQYRFMRGSLAIFHNEYQLFTTNVDGSGFATHATLPALGNTRLEADDAFENSIIYRELPTNGTATLKATPISGDGNTPLTDGQSYASYAGHVGSRVVFQRCTIVRRPDDGSLMAGPCDVHSIDANGSSLVVLASQEANEAVQGIVGNQVIIRRNLSGNDQLVAVPVGGGAERLLMTMTDSEFVVMTTEALVIVGRSNSVWTLALDGTLKRISTVEANSSVIIVGNALCYNNAYTAWCMPLDGQGQAVKIADTGRVLGAL